MPAALKIDNSSTFDHGLVTVDHFGLNFVADYERIGDRPWERFDEVIESTGAGNIRYPGGVTAETLFDITNPNAEFVLLEGGGTRAIMGAFDFAAFVNENGQTASFIVPTAPFLSDIPGQTQRGFNQEYTRYIEDYIMGVLIASEGNITTFEIGNEYESHMTSAEYGVILNALAPIAAAIIEEYNSQHPDALTGAQISVQVWSHFSNEDTIYDTDNLYGRSDNVFGQLDEVAMQAIDTLVTHWYARDHYRTYIETYNELETDILDAMSVLDHFSENFGQEFDYLISEWNTNRHETLFFGLAQAPIIIRMFAEFVQAGFDQLDFWSGQYHTNSLALSNGDLTAAGVAFAYIQDVAVGSTVYDLVTEDTSVGGVMFATEELTILSLSNLTSSTHSYTFTLPEDFDVPITISIGYLGVDSSSSDGEYKTFFDLEIYNEPDLQGTIEWVEVTLNPEESMALEFEPYQTIFIEVPEIEPDTPSILTGTLDNDYFLIEGEVSSVNGGAGVDTIDFSESASGVSIWVNENIVETSGPAVLLSFDEIEFFVGSHHNDRLTVHNGEFEAKLGSGNDSLFLGLDASGSFYMQAGDDFITSYSSDTFIYAGDGDDTIFSYFGATIDGGRGNDRVYSDSGSDTFIFGLDDGNDTLIGFNPNFDSLILQNAVINAVEILEFEVVNSENGAVFNLFGGGSIEFVGMTIEQVIDIIDL